MLLKIDCTATVLVDVAEKMGRAPWFQSGALPIFVSKLFGGQHGNHCCYAPGLRPWLLRLLSLHPICLLLCRLLGHPSDSDSLGCIQVRRKWLGLDVLQSISVALQSDLDCHNYWTATIMAGQGATPTVSRELIAMAQAHLYGIFSSLTQQKIVSLHTQRYAPPELNLPLHWSLLWAQQ